MWHIFRWRRLSLSKFLVDNKLTRKRDESITHAIVVFNQNIFDPTDYNYVLSLIKM